MTYPEPVTVDASRIHPPRRRVVLTAITSAPLDVRAHEDAVRDPRAGAVVTFAGHVRDHDHGRPVDRIEYLGHPTAPEVLAGIVEEVVADLDLEAVAVTHRVGPLEVGEIAIVVAVSAAHRHEAFAGCSRLLEEVKHRLPIWKRQELSDGNHEWVACP